VIHVSTPVAAPVCQSHAKLIHLRFTSNYACLSTHSQSEYIQLSAKCIKPSSVSWETVHRRDRRSTSHVGRDRPPGTFQHSTHEP